MEIGRMMRGWRLTIFAGVLLVGTIALGCGGTSDSPLGNKFSFAPAAADCTTPVMITANQPIDPRTQVDFVGVANTNTAGISEITGVMGTQNHNMVQTYAPCDLANGQYTLTVVPLQQSPFGIGTFTFL